MNFHAIVFDLDGTLLDSLADIATAANAALADGGWPQHPIDDYRQLVGDGVAVLFERALPEAASKDRKQIDACIAGFKKHYDVQWRKQSRPYAGIEEMLATLQSRQIPLAVLSNKPHAFTVACVDHFFAATKWTCVLGNTPELPRKPDPAGVHAILQPLNVAPANCLYVGDTNTDMQTAKAAGCYALGVTWGFRPAEELQQAGADQIIDTPAQIVSLC